MKNKLFALSILCALGAPSALACAEHEAAAKVKEPSETTVFLAKSKAAGKLTELFLPKVSCISCAYKIRKALKPMTGVRSIEVDPETQMLRFACDGCDLNEVKTKLEEIGYPVGTKT